MEAQHRAKLDKNKWSVSYVPPPGAT